MCAYVYNRIHFGLSRGGFIAKCAHVSSDTEKQNSYYNCIVVSKSGIITLEAKSEVANLTPMTDRRYGLPHYRQGSPSLRTVLLRTQTGAASTP